MRKKQQKEAERAERQRQEEAEKEAAFMAKIAEGAIDVLGDVEVVPEL